MELVNLLQSTPVFFLSTVFVLGLMVGSFLNVVILRLPKMMERDWQAQCHEYLEQEGDAEAEPLSLSKPASTCPGCGHKIRFYENIPVISWLLLRGKCAGCKTSISIRYPIIELITALLSVVVAWHFGFGWQALAALVLTWALITLSVIDFDTQLLPDAITLPFLWLGLTLSLFPLFADMRTALIGAIAGYLSLWIVYQVFKLVTGKEGMGFGDFKLLALLGAWLGWQALPIVILLSSLVGAVVGILLITVQGRDRQTPIPFGPYLAAAGWIAMLWGEQIKTTYLNYSGLSS